MNRFEKFIHNRNRSLAVGRFQPENWDEFYVHKVAMALGETEVRFLLSILERFGIEVIKSAYTELRQAMREKRHIRSRKRFFNYLIQQHINKQSK